MAFMTPMTTTPAIRAYLGGSFNPVHNSHIQMAIHVHTALADIAAEQNRVLEVSLLPNARSPFKEDTIDPAQRLAMITLAIQGTPLHVSELELWQSPPVYTIDSVRALRERYPHDSLIFIMGMDSARSLDKWKNGLELTDYVNLWIFDRHRLESNCLESNRFDTHSNVNFSAKTANNKYQNLSEQHIAALITELPTPLQKKVTPSFSDLTLPFLKSATQGRIYIDSRPVDALSSTQVREQLAITTPLPHAPLSPNPPPNSLAKWLNPTVYHYIIAHQLYSAAQFR